MSENIDPELGSEVDDDQLGAADQLEDIVTEDILDEGYSPNDRDTRVHWGETALEESMGESLEMRLAQEVPDDWSDVPRYREDDRSGRIEVVAEGSWQQDAYARDAGVAGGAASAEEAAMHTIDFDDLVLDETVLDREGITSRQEEDRDDSPPV